MKNVFLAPGNYRESDPNPFTPDGAYDRSWSILIVDASVRGMLFQRKSPFGCYVMAVNPAYAHFRDLMSDILYYETGNGRKVILSGGELSFLDSLEPLSPVQFRAYDGPYMVHSTTLDAYAHILQDGLLKPAAQLMREGRETQPIGLAPLGEPEDYLEHIMFADSGPVPEIVVNSRLHGAPCYSMDEPYRPQARMYFDARKLTADGMVVHNVCRMVRGVVELKRYLVRTVTAGDVALPEGQDCWTPLTFSKAADTLMGL